MINWKHKDKQQHFGVGFLIAFVLGLLHPLAGVIGALVAGGVKEIYDYFHQDTNTPDWGDALATWLGGAAGLILLMVLFR